MNGKLTEVVRAIVRPVITLSGWGCIIYLAVRGIITPDVFVPGVMALVAWWFATRPRSV